MIYRIYFLLVFVFISFTGLGQDNRPNILVIITDQHSGKVMTQTGYEYIKTPGIDKIADQGVTFTRSYVTYPVCMSSRRSFMTGLMPSKAEPPTDYPSIGSVLSENGYETVYRGKWHVGSTDINEVREWHGFNTYKESKVDSTIARWSRDYLKQEHDKPFFMVASFLNPHNICEFARNMTGLTNQGYDDGAVEEHIDTSYCPLLPSNFAIPKNEAEGLSTRRNQDPGDEHWAANPHKGWTDSQWRQYMYGYDRFLEKVDARVEEVYDELAKQGLLENTIVIYTSDHGDAHASHQWTQKKNFYEEVVNIPFVVSWKGKTKAGVIDEETLVSNGLDLYPTILKMAGIDIPDYLPGEDLSSVFLKDAQGDPIERDYVVTELDQKVYKSNTPGVFNGRMVVTKKFKYFLFDQGANKEQLFDLENDPGELHPVTYDPAYHDDLLACRAKLKEWVATQNDDFDVDAAIYSVKYDVKRLNKGQPIITQQMFSELGVADEGENINGPGVIRIPEWISPENRAHPDAEYYCYFAHHDGEYIRMAWASDIDSPDIGQFRNSYQKAFLRKDMSYMGKRVPFAYIWDDHDFGPNNSDKTAPGRLQSGRAYRECIPHYPLAASEKNGAIYQAFTVNNTRFVVTDLRSRRDENDKPDNAQKSMMGKEQFSWFMNEIKESSEKYPLVIWVSSVPYTAEKKEGEDDWGGFTHERRVIANFIKKNDINNLMIVSGDAHCTLYNNGLENNYSNYEGEGLFEILASPLDNWATSVKGGSWTDVYRPKDGQLVYGMAEVVFSNNKTTVHFKTFDTNHQVVIQAEKSFKIENKKD